MAAVVRHRPSPPALAKFMGALRAQESGGNYHEANGDGAYQILASNWPSWAAAAGYPQWAHGNASSAPPAVQDAVARHQLLGYYYGPAHRSWFAVAQAWNGGAGCIDGNCANPYIPGGVNGYAHEVLARMGNVKGVKLRRPPTGGAAGFNPPPGGSISDKFGGVPASKLPADPNAGDPAGIVSCYIHIPTISIPVPLLPDPHIGGWCVDGLVFGLLTLVGGTAMLVGVALIAKGVGSQSAAVNSLVAKTRTVSKI